MGNMSYYKKSIKLARETQYLPLLMQCTQKLGELTAKLQADISKRVVEETQHIAPPALSESDHKFLDEMAIFVKEQLADSDLSTISLAEEFCMSPRQFSRRVKQLTGLDVTHFIRSRRIFKAVQLLKNTELPISEIYIKCGFESANYFTRVFHKQMGMTPTQYRKQENNNN